jgi:hypothetical protein
MNKTSLFALIGAGAIAAGVVAAAMMLGRQEAAEAARGSIAAPIAAVSAPAPVEAPAPTLTTSEADAWGQARAINSLDAYKMYLAAYPTGAFREEAAALMAKAAPPAATPKPKAVRVVRASTPASAPAPFVDNGPQVFPAANPLPPAPAPEPRIDVAALCRAQVDQMLSAPSKTYRIVGGAAAGCGAGTLAGGDDGRNCAVGAVLGGAIGAVTAENRERRREREVQACIANGGPR